MKGEGASKLLGYSQYWLSTSHPLKLSRQVKSLGIPTRICVCLHYRTDYLYLCYLDTYDFSINLGAFQFILFSFIKLYFTRLYMLIWKRWPVAFMPNVFMCIYITGAAVLNQKLLIWKEAMISLSLKAFICLVCFANAQLNKVSSTISFLGKTAYNRDFLHTMGIEWASRLCDWRHDSYWWYNYSIQRTTSWYECVSMFRGIHLEN